MSCSAPGLAATARAAPACTSLLVGSEGTLGVIAEAELNLVPRPKVARPAGAAVRHLAAAMDALAACLEMQPSAVELMDQMLHRTGRAATSPLRDTMAAIDRARPRRCFMVEFSGDDAGRGRRPRREAAATAAAASPALIAPLPAIDPAIRDPLWNLRSAAVPLLLRHAGRPQAGHVRRGHRRRRRSGCRSSSPRFRDLLHRHGTDGAFYGHASVGCLHIRPC